MDDWKNQAMTQPGIDDWLRRIRLGEDSTLELKQVVFRGEGKIMEPHPDGLADEIAALANGRGGVLVLGVDDRTREVRGIPVERLATVESLLREICNDKIRPPVQAHSRHLELPDAAGQSQPVVVLEVPRSLWVHESPNGYFLRVLDAKRKMTPDLLARLFQQRSQTRLIRFEEQPVADATPSDLDPLLIRPLVRPEQGPIERQLQRLHLLTELDGELRPTVTGVLLCAYQPQQWLRNAEIVAVAYRGARNDPNEQMDAREIGGPLDRQIWDALHFVRRNMRVPARKELGRVEMPQYSERAVFEAIVNAVAHRDYALHGSRIRLFLFEDRLELYSPGALPNSMSIEAMTEMSMPRNDVLCSLFSRYYPVRELGLGREFLMDRRGSGVEIILAESEKLSGRRPMYENLDDLELRLTLYPAAPPWENP